MTTMQGIQDALKKYELQKQEKKKGRREQERDAPFNELYRLYTSVTQRNLRRKENWRRYILWLKVHRIKHTTDSVAKFRKTRKGSKLFIQGLSFVDEWGVSTFAVKISHIKGEMLYYTLSVARDKDNRGESIGAWLFAKPK